MTVFDCIMYTRVDGAELSRQRMRMDWRATQAWMVAVVMASGCLPELEKTQGENLLYEHSAEFHACAGNAAYLDELVVFLEGELGAAANAALRYSWLIDKDIPWGLTEDEGGNRRRGKVAGNHAWSVEPVLVHELTHLVYGSHSAAFFVEGIAVATDMVDNLGARYALPEQAAELLIDPRSSMSASSSSGVDYTAAGLFVTFLLVRHGPERFRDFYTSLVWPFTTPRIEAQFRRVYGVELDAEIEVFTRGAPPCTAMAFDLKVPECSAPTVPWEGAAWMYVDTMDCDAPGVVGGITPDGAEPSFRVVTVDVPAAGRYELRSFGDDGAGVFMRFGPCFGCPWNFSDVALFTRDEVASVQLEAGKYYVRLNALSDESPLRGVSLTPIP